MNLINLKNYVLPPLLIAGVIIFVFYVSVSPDQKVLDSDRNDNFVAIPEPMPVPVAPPTSPIATKNETSNASLFVMISREDGLLWGNGPEFEHNIETVFSADHLKLVKYPHFNGTLYALVDTERGQTVNYVSSGSYAITDYQNVIYFVNDDATMSYYKPGMSNIEIVPGSELVDHPGDSYNFSDGAFVQPKFTRNSSSSISIAIFRKLELSENGEEYVFNPKRAEINRYETIKLP